eukprot:CAMPEP_0172443964 /NCGR_PEP_ID=MMETSP1065-20121228/4136_1 /TAXON_ID=265537 /ORGANISM="Amphiprora paludosa, Strain CCMP125" /LENGTH=611 /DNA_ID=CAMNT_0013194377 /DNA_START=215 /DNA_END=2050 /DNA_ORIENTATION=+
MHEIASQNKPNLRRKEQDTAVICVVQKEEYNYIDEWVDYHLAIGFSDIYIYDNVNQEQADYMVDWQEQRNDPRIHLIPYPGDKVQVPVYKDCARRVAKYNHTYVTFLDVDEFLVLKQHQSVLELANDYISPQQGGGHLAINWEMFGTAGRHSYEPFPVTQRFQCIYQTIRNEFVKSLIRVQDLDPVDRIRSPHTFPLRNGTQRIDTSRRIVTSSRHEGPRDVAVINHYYFRSFEEYVNKRKRGDVFYGAKGANPGHSQSNLTAQALAGLDPNGNPIPSGYKQDDSAWKTLRQLVPAYEKYETNGPQEPFECSDEIPPEIAPKTTDTVALCTIHKDETWYINEWVDYHFGMGFSDIYLYDNSDEIYHLLEWTKRHSDPGLHYTDFTGEGMQIAAYQACIERAKQRQHTWLMFLDIDQFLVLKQHDNVLDFAKQYGQKGHVAINWEVYGTAGRSIYEPFPVTYRFQCLVPQSEKNQLVESLVRVSDLGPTENVVSSHVFPTRTGIHTTDTNGHRVEGETNPKGPRDVAVVNHYYYRSQQEFVEKMKRGDAATGEYPDDLIHQAADDGLDPFDGEEIPVGDVRENQAWLALKKYNEKYETTNYEKKKMKEIMHC